MWVRFPPLVLNNSNLGGDNNNDGFLDACEDLSMAYKITLDTNNEEYKKRIKEKLIEYCEE